MLYLLGVVSLNPSEHRYKWPFPLLGRHQQGLKTNATPPGKHAKDSPEEGKPAGGSGGGWEGPEALLTRGAEARVRRSGTAAILETSSSRRLASSQLRGGHGPRPFTSPSPAPGGPNRPTASARGALCFRRCGWLRPTCRTARGAVAPLQPAQPRRRRGRGLRAPSKQSRPGEHFGSGSRRGFPHRGLGHSPAPARTRAHTLAHAHTRAHRLLGQRCHHTPGERHRGGQVPALCELLCCSLHPPLTRKPNRTSFFFFSRKTFHCHHLKIDLRGGEKEEEGII